MAKRLQLDDALLRLSKDPTTMDITEALPVYLKDRQETHYIRQSGDDDIYLCGKSVVLQKVKPFDAKVHSSYSELRELCTCPSM